MLNVCQICGKEFETEYSFQKYCSNKCYKQATSIRYRKLYKPKEYPERKCACCGKLFKPKNKNQINCSYSCKRKMVNEVNRVRGNILYQAKKYGYSIGNMSKVLKDKREKLKGDLMLCPYAIHQKDRYCGSYYCLYETETEGKCLCGVFIKGLKNNSW